MKRILIGLLCLLSLVCCQKGPVTVVYLLGVSVEGTNPKEIADPDIRETYETLWSDLQRDINNLVPDVYFLFPNPQEITVEINRKVVSMDPKDVPAEDEKRIAEFDEYQSKLKEIETSYRERIEGLEKRDGVSFCINGQLLLLRAREDAKNDGILKEYKFELKYN